MDLELYDCRHCNTFGVLPTSDGKCPNCRQSLGAEDKQGSHSPNWAPCPTSSSKEEERPQKTRRLVIALRVILPGVLVLLASPATYIRFYYEHGQLTGTTWELPGELIVHPVAARAIRLLLAGWVLIELGLLVAKPRRILWVLLRIPLYLFIVATIAMIVLDFLFSLMGP